MQLAHEVDAAIAAYVPLRQSVHVFAATPEIEPASQSSQLPAPTLLAYLPGSQFVQAVSASADMVPAEQFEHEDALDESGIVPAKHAVHLVDLVLDHPLVPQHIEDL